MGMELWPDDYARVVLKNECSYDRMILLGWAWLAWLAWLGWKGQGGMGWSGLARKDIQKYTDTFSKR